jgi:hypothetical protein
MTAADAARCPNVCMRGFLSIKARRPLFDVVRAEPVLWLARLQRTYGFA